jgi:hypothetical protein
VIDLSFTAAENSIVMMSCSSASLFKWGSCQLGSFGGHLGSFGGQLRAN